MSAHNFIGSADLKSSCAVILPGDHDACPDRVDWPSTGAGREICHLVMQHHACRVQELAYRGSGFPKFPTVDHWNSPGDERCGGPGMSLRGCQVRSSWPVSSAMVTGSSQCGQQPPVPARRMNVPHWSQR